MYSMKYNIVCWYFVILVLQGTYLPLQYLRSLANYFREISNSLEVAKFYNYW